MAFGITPAGFTPMRLQDIKLALETALQTAFGDINLEPTSVFGQFVGVMSKICSDWWQALEDTYLSEYPATASGVALDNVVAMTGITRLPSSATRVTCSLTGTGGTVVPANSQVMSTNGDVFSLEEAVTIPGDGIFVALVNGPIPAIDETVSTIVTPISGWDTVLNDDPGTVGRNQETDAELRVRRELSLSIIGAGTIESIQARVVDDVPDVTSCIVYENTQDIVVAGRPPHSIEIIVVGGDDQDIADTIWQVKPAGIQLYHRTAGGVTASVIDSNGDTQVIYFTRPTTTYLHVQIDIIQYNLEETFPIDGEDQIKNAMLAFMTPAVIGKDVITQRWFGPIFSVPGLSDVVVTQGVTVNPGDTPTLTTDNIIVPATEMVEAALGRITINL